jgi:hypothetical protein
LLLAAPLQDPPQDTPRDPLAQTEPAITAADIEQHVRFLASDELMGRPAASEHTRRAARYLARTFEKFDLAGGADDGSFLQPVPFERTEWSAAHQLRLSGPGGSEQLEHGVAFSVRIRGAARSTGVLSLLHVRAAADIPTTPDPRTALVFHASTSEVRDWLEARGAVDGAGFGLVVKLGSEKQGNPRGTPRGGLRMVTEEVPDGVEELTLRGPLLAALDAFDALELTFHVQTERLVDYNVVARIDGVGTPEQPELAREVIVLSAHYDHIGTRGEPQEGVDTINNGADDDASGVAAVLEIAEAFQSEAAPPARTLLFLLATAEEDGMRGTRWFVQHPPVPLERIVCNLNFEMLGRPDELVGAGKLWLTGYERSSLGPAFAAAGLDIVADARPEQSFFTRSDNIIFVQQGIVGQTLSTYNMHGDYHQPSDEADTLDFQHMQGAVRAGFLASKLLASAAVTPAWNEGEPAIGRQR